MLTQDIIKRFELYVDDGTELSSQEELDLLNQKYTDVWTNRPWEFAKKSFSASISGSSVAIPTDFAYITENGQYTDISMNNVNGNSAPKIIWIGSNKYLLVNWSDRKQYEGKAGYCYVDIRNSLLVFTESVSGTVEFDYVFFPEALALSDEPLFPAAYHQVLVHLMATDDYIIQQFDKARSYSAENQAKANYWLEKMQLWNANLSCY